MNCRTVLHAAKCFVSGLLFLPALAQPVLAQQYDQKLFAEMRWRCIGPFRAGRTVAISGVPHQPNLFYMAAVNGGVWKTTDFGNAWSPIFDDQPTGSVGALAVAPSDPNIIYVGSGEGLQRPDLSTGDGIYKSADAGKSWTHLGLRDAQQITAILVDPKDPSRLFVAAEGHPYGPNDERGVFRSTDGGQSFRKILYKDENTGGADLAFNPGNSQIIYATLWAARVAPWEIRSGESFITAGSGIFKSVDSGNTWLSLNKGLPAAEDQIGRIGIAISHSQPNRIYATVEAKKNAGIYRSDDAGESWKLVNSDHRIGGRGPGAMGIAVAPDNPDVIYVANTTTWKSTDGGKTFVGFKGAPGGDDYQRIWISTENPQTIALSSDQGAIVSVNGGATWSSWYNQPTAQFYHVTTDNRFPYWVYGAQQESGSAGTMSRSDYGEITFREWHSVGVFEYGYITVDPLDPNFIYGARLTRTNQALGEVADIAPEPIRRGEYRYDRTLPVVFSPLDPHALYFSANVLFKTMDGGKNWKIVSPDLTRESYEIPANLGVFTKSDPEKGKHRGVIYAVAPSFKDVDTIWAGTDDGLIHLTRDSGKSWQNVTPPQLTPWSKVSIIEAGHFDAGTAYVAVNRFRLDDLHAYIYRTRDFGKSWQEITKGLPDNAPVNAVREDPLHKGLLFAGSETSVYVSFSDGDAWQPLQLNLPHTSMRDLAIHGDDLIVATHGRSFWILDDITPLRQLNSSVADAQVHLFAPQEAVRFRWNRNTDTPLPPEVAAGKNPPDGAIVDYYLGAASNSPVKLEIFDAQSRLVRSYASTDKPKPLEKIAAENPIPLYWVRPTNILYAEAGMHRFVWDLHYPPPLALEHEYPISAIYQDTPEIPLGAWPLPGSYTVKLTAAGKSVSQPLIVKMDPRIQTPLADLQKQFDMESGAVNGMNESFQSLAQVQSVRAQLKDRAAHVPKGPLSDALAVLDKQLIELEGSAETNFFGLPTAGKQPENFSTLHQHFASLLGVADSADAAPTSQATAVYQELQDALKTLSMRWTKLRDQDIPALNADLEKAGLAPLDYRKPAETPPSADHSGNDEP
ncbi:MAG TPA: glycoside hydrolase [Candidatus Dormibacteraeota bacterium]|nr:glycoside hydrolase [Candidatus Dormibacteraeota bacterium]